MYAMPSSTQWPRDPAFYEKNKGLLTVAGFLQVQWVARVLLQHYGPPTGPLVINSTNKPRTKATARAFAEVVAPGPSARVPTVNVEVGPATPTHVDDSTKEASAAHRLIAYGNQEGRLRLGPDLRAKLFALTHLAGFTAEASVASQVAATHYVCTLAEIDRHLHFRILDNEEHITLTKDEVGHLKEARRLGYYTKWGLTDEEARLNGYVGAARYLSVLRSLVAGRWPHGTFYYYAVHDTTLMAFLSALGFTDFEIPSFAALIIFEGRTDGTVHFRYVAKVGRDLAHWDRCWFAVGPPGKLRSMPDCAVKEGVGTPVKDLSLVLNYCPICKTTDGTHKEAAPTATALYKHMGGDFSTKGGPALPPCSLCGGPSRYLCGRCKRAHYCSADHQRLDWPQHGIKCHHHAH
jgi:hypothetical protein